MPLVSSVVLPHGAMVSDGSDGCTAAAAERLNSISETMKEDCQVLFESARAAAELAKATKPDVIFLNTPHGVCLSDTLCVYLRHTVCVSQQESQRQRRMERAMDGI